VVCDINPHYALRCDILLSSYLGKGEMEWARKPPKRLSQSQQNQHSGGALQPQCEIYTVVLCVFTHDDDQEL